MSTLDTGGMDAAGTPSRMRPLAARMPPLKARTDARGAVMRTTALACVRSYHRRRATDGAPE